MCARDASPGYIFSHPLSHLNMFFSEPLFLALAFLLSRKVALSRTKGVRVAVIYSDCKESTGVECSEKELEGRERERERERTESKGEWKMG